MTKIALISGDSSASGAPSHVLRLAIGLKENKFDVLIIAPHGNLIKECQKARIGTQEVEMGGPFDRKAAHKLREVLQKYNPEIAHFHGVRGGWIGRLAARKLPKIKKVYTEHLWTKVYHLSNPAYEKFQLNGLKFMDRWTDKTIAVSNAVRDFLVSRRFNKNKIVVIPNGINPEFIELNRLKKPKEAPLILGSIGSLNQVKNYRNMILAVVRAKEKLPKLDFHYQIIGEGPLKKSLEILARKKKIEKNIHFVGKVESIGERLQHFTIFLGASNSESFGLATGEAMASGLPVIASDIDSLKELVGDCGLLVNPRRIDDIAKAIVRLLEDENLREKLGKCAKARIKRSYLEENMVRRTIAVYKELLRE